MTLLSLGINSPPAKYILYFLQIRVFFCLNCAEMDGDCCDLSQFGEAKCVRERPATASRRINK